MSSPWQRAKYILYDLTTQSESVYQMTIPFLGWLWKVGHGQLTMNFLDNKKVPMWRSAQQYTNLILWRHKWTVSFHTFPPRSCVQSDSNIASELRIRKRLLAVINNSVSNGFMELFQDPFIHKPHTVIIWGINFLSGSKIKTLWAWTGQMNTTDTSIHLSEVLLFKICNGLCYLKFVGQFQVRWRLYTLYTPNKERENQFMCDQLTSTRPRQLIKLHMT